MAGKFGTFQLAEGVTHVSIANDDVDLTDVDRSFTPSSEEEAAACQHLCTVSRTWEEPAVDDAGKPVTDEDGHPVTVTKSEALAEQTDGPDPEPDSSEPAATAPSASAAGVTGPSSAQILAGAEAELAKAEADVAAAEKSQPPTT